MADTIDTSNYVYLCMTAHGWGTSPTSERDAIKACREANGSSHLQRAGYVTYRVHPKFEISEIDGTVYVPQGHPVIKLNDRRTKWTKDGVEKAAKARKAAALSALNKFVADET